MNKLPVLVLLQNQWHPKPHIMRRTREKLYGGDHVEHVRACLFGAPSQTGARIATALRDCNLRPEMLYFADASPRISECWSEQPPPDVPHITKLLETIQPKAVIGLGKQAKIGLERVFSKTMFDVVAFFEPHPMSQVKGIQARLRRGFAKVRLMFNEDVFEVSELQGLIDIGDAVCQRLEKKAVKKKSTTPWKQGFSVKGASFAFKQE